MFPVVEKFVSINGEGAHAGEISAFIRFRKCNLNCAYCDTRWANSDNAEAEMMSAEELAEWVKERSAAQVS
ncbi:MAG: 7-carboxy-7-deazaguanine synthase QueE, partial [Ruminococcus sp.]|nr:7-carboxy-7-deazaguanine synthase QueE [Ruminococcus sp.]